MSKYYPHRSSSTEVAIEDALREEFIDPWKDKDKRLAQYLSNVLQWHGYMRFVGLPLLRDNPDIPVNRLFVEPNLAGRHLLPDTPLDQWQPLVPAQQALENHPRLVVLGDPGSGKSTLVTWLAWQTARRKLEPWSEVFDGLIPLPLVLRDLPIRRGVTWESLMEAFLNLPMCQGCLDAAMIERLMHSGQALLLLDGLDEIGSVAVREDLRAAVFEAMEKFPRTRWLMTSRIVGYYDVPFDEYDASNVCNLASKDLGERYLLQTFEAFGEVYSTIRVADLLYAAPFNDEQIYQFSRNWFGERVMARELAFTQANAFAEAIRRHQTTQRLARTPNLLTMMILIYRIKARLPHGRATLYNEIAQAYLQSIDEYRGLQQFDYPLEVKKQWLAHVGFQLQSRRAAAAVITAERDDYEGGREILAEHDEVIDWVAEAMRESGYGGGRQDAEQFVDYIGRRSGLLLPRGVGRFAFMHLSFQEYFAACYLQEKLLAQRLSGGEPLPGCGPHDLAQYANEKVWQETLVFLFELGASQPGWSSMLVNMIYGVGLERIVVDRSAIQRSDRGAISDNYDPEQRQAALLLAALVIDPHAGFPAAERQRIEQACVRWGIHDQESQLMQGNIHDAAAMWRQLLAAEEPQKSAILGRITAVIGDTTVQRLALSDCSVTDLSPLASLKGLLTLDLNFTPVTDLSPLAGLTELKILELIATPVTDLSPLAGLTELQVLDLDSTAVSDLSPLAGLTGLRVLNLRSTPVTDLSPIRNCREIRILVRNKLKMLYPAEMESRIF